MRRRLYDALLVVNDYATDKSCAFVNKPTDVYSDNTAKNYRVGRIFVPSVIQLQRDPRPFSDTHKIVNFVPSVIQLQCDPRLSRRLTSLSTSSQVSSSFSATQTLSPILTIQSDLGSVSEIHKLIILSQVPSSFSVTQILSPRRTISTT